MEKIDFSKMSHIELLKMFKNDFEKYDEFKDEELNFLEEHPNRDMWDAQMENEYDSIVADIKWLYNHLHKLCEYIETIK